MGNPIRANASVDAILRDVRKTKANAAARGAPFVDDAERYLGPVLATDEELASPLVEARQVLSQARSERNARNQACNDLVAASKDHLYNLIGRTARDTRFVRYYPGGNVRYIGVPLDMKPDAIEQLCSTLETVPHPRIPPSEVKRVTTAHREAAQALAEANRQVRAADARVRILSGQVTANARVAAEQLAKLKRWWKIEGLSEPDIHQLIPDRPQRRRTSAEPAAPEDGAPVDRSPEEPAELDDLEMAAK